LRRFKTDITDLDELKQRLRMEWAKLDHVVAVAAVFLSGVMYCYWLLF